MYQLVCMALLFNVGALFFPNLYLLWQGTNIERMASAMNIIPQLFAIVALLLVLLYKF